MNRVFTLLQVSDLHFGPPYVPRVGEALLRIAPRLEPDAVVVSGDLTQRARREQFEEARRFIGRLPDVPRIVVPGNHDVPALWRFGERLSRPLELYREVVQEEVDFVRHFDNAVVVALNSTAPRRSISNGRIQPWQLKFCEDALAEVPEHVLKIVVAHHHFAPAPDYARDQTMPGAKKALDAFVRMRVDAILGGHLHRAYIGNSLDVYAGRDREHGIVIVQCGTSTSRKGRAREKEKNSFNVLRGDDQTLQVTHFTYFDDLGEFAATSRHDFPRVTSLPTGLPLTGTLDDAPATGERSVAAEQGES